MKAGRGFLLQGWLIWGAALGTAFLLPGRVLRTGRPPDFPWGILPATAALVAALVLGALLAAWALGPALARSRSLALWEAPPELLWGGLALALWPAAWGPPGRGAWAAAFLAAAWPSEVRWLAQALPEEYPFPQVWGPRAVRHLRGLALRTLAPQWIAARLPLWITATLVLEGILAVKGLGSDWLGRVAAQDRTGLALWVLAYALLWTLARHRAARP